MRTAASMTAAAKFATAPEVHRQRFLTPEETQRLVGSIHADRNQIAAKAIMLLLLTGARRREVTRARWEDVDWEKRTLLVPMSKSGKPRTIALNAAAIALFRTAVSDSASPYIFPTQLSGLFCPWNRIRRRAGLADVRLHDLRHSFASFLVNQGVSLYVVQNLLGHTQVRMTQRYAHLAPQTLLDAAEVAALVIQPGPPMSDSSDRLPGARNQPTYAIPTPPHHPRPSLRCDASEENPAIAILPGREYVGPTYAIPTARSRTGGSLKHRPASFVSQTGPREAEPEAVRHIQHFDLSYQTGPARSAPCQVLPPA